MNAKVGGIDMSGATCGQPVIAWENQFTRWSLEGIAQDTGAVANGQPIVISVKQDGTPGPASGSDPRCPTASNLGGVVTSAIAELTNNQAQPITAVPFDFDDATDYDGRQGARSSSPRTTWTTRPSWPASPRSRPLGARGRAATITRLVCPARRRISRFSSRSPPRRSR